ncbi:MAG: beta-lactamase [Paenibacillaceae bacterium]|jgi:CubicO group peptidase (beta-lactamase class C family)|nr:beta-lactamase [Paenibacillaceae bacterium]
MKKYKKVLFIVFLILACAAVGLFGYYLYGKYKLGKIPALTFEETLEYTTADQPDAVVTVGIIKNGETSYTVYGADGQVLPPELHTYEIGSLTKTFTAALIGKAIQEGKLEMSYSIDRYIPLPSKNYYPTIEQLLTHTSGYKPYYFETPMIANFFSRRNDYYGITQDMLMEKIADVNLKDREYPFQYSNFGYAVLGLVLENVYQEDYTTLVNAYIKDELHLPNTKVSEGSGDLNHYWDWKEQDAYIPAGALVSNISDMMVYVKKQLEKNPPYLEKCQETRKIIDASTEGYMKMGIRMDEVGMSWMKDRGSNITWHNGGTDDYNCYIGFNTDTQTGVVILSNLSPGYKIPATISGIKLLLSIQL